MKTYYIYSQTKEKFVKISKSDLVAGDIICCKNDNGFIHIDNSTIFVVINPESNNGVFRVRSLMVALGAVKHAKQSFGIYFFPHELDQYITGDKLNEDLVDINWGYLQFRGVAKEWVDFVETHIDKLLEKNCSD